MTLLASSTSWRGAWRQLRAEPGPAALVIAGLALGLALTLLTVGFLRDTLWPDAHLPEVDRLVAFEWKVRGPGGLSEWYGTVPATPLSRALRDTGAPVAEMSRVITFPLLLSAVDAQGAQHHARLSTILADVDIASLFDIQPLAGDVRAALASPDGVTLTEDSANKLFGTATNAVGRPVTVTTTVEGEQGKAQRLTLTMTVMAVVPAPSKNSTLGYDAIAGFNVPAARTYADRYAMWSWGNGKLYARLKPGATAAQVGDLAQRLFDKQPAPEGMPAEFLKDGTWAYLRALPVLDVGLHGAGSPDRRLRLGSIATAAAGVLALAIINFVNLWSVRTLKRQREIGLRKSLGANARALGAQFFIEALAVAGLAGVLGLLLAWWATPAVSVLMQHSFDAPVLAPAMVAFAALLCVAIAAFSALPLTRIALRVRPAESLAGRSHSEGTASRWLRRVMTTVQFGAAALFAAMALAVAWQTKHVGDMPRGFEIDDRLAVDLPPETMPPQVQSLLARIHSWPEVIAAAASPDVPGRDLSKWYSAFTGPSGRAVDLRTNHEFTPGWLKLYGVRVLAGSLSADHRAEEAKDGAVLDRSAAAALGFASPAAAIGQQLGVHQHYRNGRPVTVVAVIEDMRFDRPRLPRTSNILTPVVEHGTGVLSVHSREPAETRRKLTALLKETLPAADAQVMSVREHQATTMAEDTRIGTLIGVTGALALLLAAVGIYALAAYTLRRREREIVLRKLHGAGAGAVARLLAMEFAGVLLAACVVALPAAAWITQLYLSGFVVRAPVGPGSLWVLLASVALLALVTALAVARHLSAALALRPLQALRG